MGTPTVTSLTAISPMAAINGGSGTGVRLAQVETTSPADAGAGATGTDTTVATIAEPVVNAAGTISAGEPNWWVLMGLIYLAAGLIAFAASVIGRGNWTEGTPDQLERAAQTHAFNVSGATFLALVGLAFLGTAQFGTLSMGPLVVLLLLGLMLLPLVHLLSADLFGDAGFDEGIEDDVQPAEPMARAAVAHSPSGSVAAPLPGAAPANGRAQVSTSVN